MGPTGQSAAAALEWGNLRFFAVSLLLPFSLPFCFLLFLFFFIFSSPLLFIIIIIIFGPIFPKPILPLSSCFIFLFCYLSSIFRSHYFPTLVYRFPL